MDHKYIAQSNVIDQYVLGKLATDEAEAFENHFIDCPECVEQLSITRSLVHDLKGLAVEQTLLSGNRRVESRRRWQLQLVPLRWAAAIALGCVAVAAVFAFLAVRRQSQLEAKLQQAQNEVTAIRRDYQREMETSAASEKQHDEARQQLARRLAELEERLKTEEAGVQSPVRGSGVPEVNFPIFALVSVARGQAPAPVEIALPSASSRFALSIPVEDRREFSVYRVAIVDQRGVTVFKRSGFKPDAYHALSLSLSSKFLAPGTYDLRVEGLTRPNQWSTVGSYPFRLTGGR
jgi:uncharacterized membrane-anchored protein YhcB (DUF1043 family)